MPAHFIKKICNVYFRAVVSNAANKIQGFVGNEKGTLLLF
jgi:hypothetical protein